MNKDDEFTHAWNAFHEKDDTIPIIKEEIEEHLRLLNRVTTVIEFDAEKNRIKSKHDEIRRLESLAKEAIKGNLSIEQLISALSRDTENSAPTYTADSDTFKRQSTTTPLSTTRRTRTDGLLQAMRAGITTYRNTHHMEPTARALFEWLASHDETDTIVEFNTDKDVLTWKLSSGGLKDIPFNSFQNRFTRLRK